MLAMVMAMLMAGGTQAELGVAPANTQANRGHPDAVDLQIQQAVVDARAGHNAEALTYLDPMAVAVTNRVGEAKVPVYCARSLAEGMGYLSRATPASPVVRLIEPRLCSVLFMRAYVLENLNRFPEAIEQMRQLLALEPNFPHYQVEYAAALRQAGDMDAALAAYRRAVDIAAPVKEYALDQAAALRGVGFILTERGDLDGAEKAYRQSVDLAPGHPIALHELTYIARLRATGAKAPSQTLQSSINPAAVPIPVDSKAQ